MFPLRTKKTGKIRSTVSRGTAWRRLRMRAEEVRWPFVITTVRMVCAELRLPASTIRCMSADYIPVRMHGSLSPNLRKNDLETCEIRKTYRWFVLSSHNTLTAEFICNIIKIEQLENRMFKYRKGERCFGENTGQRLWEKQVKSWLSCSVWYCAWVWYRV